jgi:hypothetical protein
MAAAPSFPTTTRCFVDVIAIASVCVCLFIKSAHSRSAGDKQEVSARPNINIKIIHSPLACSVSQFDASRAVRLLICFQCATLR